MKVERPTGVQPSFGWRLNKKQAELIRGLPKDKLDRFEKRMINAPMDDTKEASDVRDKILREALSLARRLKRMINEKR